jgi:hypothetical protein
MPPRRQGTHIEIAEKRESRGEPIIRRCQMGIQVLVLIGTLRTIPQGIGTILDLLSIPALKPANCPCFFSRPDLTATAGLTSELARSW